MRSRVFHAVATLIAFLLPLVLFLLVAPATPRGQNSFRDIVDKATGVKIALPDEFLSREKTTKFGSNWSSPDGNVNVDSLGFPAGKTLKSVYDGLRRIRGRTLTRDEWRGVKFTLEGKDSDGSNFVVEVHQGDAGLRGYSIVYSRRKSITDLLRNRIAQSFEPFPSSRSSSTGADTAMVQPHQAQPGVPLSPYVVGGIALGDQVRETGEYSCRLNTEMEKVRWCQKRENSAASDLPNTVMQAGDGSAIYVLSHQDRGLNSKRDAEAEIEERSRVFREQPAKIYWLPVDNPVSVIALWGQIRLEDVIFPDIDLANRELTSQLGNIEGSDGDPKSSEGAGSVYRIVGGKGFLYSASLDGSDHGHKRLLAIDASQIATRQFGTKLSVLLRKDQSLAADDITLWPSVAYATRRLARDTSPAEANEALDAVFSASPSQKYRSHAWSVLPGGVQEGLSAGEFRTVDIYGANTTYPVIRQDIEKFLAGNQSDRFIEFPLYVIGEFDAALKANPNSVIAPVLHYGSGHRVIASIVFDAVDALKRRTPEIANDGDFVPSEERGDPVNEPVNRSIRLLNQNEDRFEGRLSSLVPDFESRASVARPHFEAVVQSKSSPHADDAAYMLSWLDFYLGKYEDAVAQFERAMSQGNQDYKQPAAMKQMVRVMEQQYNSDKQSTLVGQNQTFSQQPALWYVAARSGYRLFKYEFVIEVTRRALDSLHISLDRLPDTTDANRIEEDLQRMDPDLLSNPNTPEIIYLHQASKELLAYEKLLSRIGSEPPEQFAKRAREIITKYSLLLDAENEEGKEERAGEVAHRDLRQATHMIDATMKSLQKGPALDHLREWLYYRKTRIAVTFAPSTIEDVVAAMEAEVPRSELMDDALVELLYSEGIRRDLRSAEATFKKIQDKYPNGNALDNAYTWMAKIYRCEGRLSEAEKLNLEIVRKFPISRHALLARGRLAIKEPKACGLPLPG